MAKAVTPRSAACYVAKKPRKCFRCHGVIPAGSTYAGFRERAISYKEARDAGTLHPFRHLCLTCAAKEGR